MARENQGLQIALISFVILTILLGVGTFYFFKQWEDAELRAKANQEKEAQKTKEVIKANEDMASMKKWIGQTPDAAFTKVNEDFNKDMTTYGGAYPAESRFYRKVLEQLYNELQKKNEALTAEQNTVKDVTAKLQQFEASKEPVIAGFQSQAKKAADDLAAQRQQFNDDRGKLNQEKDELAGRIVKTQKQSEETLGQLGSRLETANNKIRTLVQMIKDRTGQLEEAKKQTFEIAHGKIRWVNQRTGTVWINLGQADNLNRQTSFAVYTMNTNDVTQANKKASIEVTQILGDHLAEARVVEDSVSNPIMPGDVIYTPLWKPGEQLHVALAGLLDVDGDGKSDLEMLRSMIASSGTIVDMYVDDNGKKQGKMTTDTRYLVLGKVPETKAGPADKTGDDSQTVFTSVMREAETLGLKTIPLHELLTRVGFKNENRVVSFGPGSNVNDFRPQPPDGVQKVSGGSVSPLFQPRKPPRGAQGSAY